MANTNETDLYVLYKKLERHLAFLTVIIIRKNYIINRFKKILLEMNINIY